MIASCGLLNGVEESAQRDHHGMWLWDGSGRGHACSSSARARLGVNGTCGMSVA